MNRILATCAALIVLAQSFNLSLSDVVHFDDLLKHYEYHQETFGDNLFVFLSKHYGEHKAEHIANHQEEREDYEKLPFEHHCCVHTVIPFVNTPNTGLPIPKITPDDREQSNFYYQNTYSFSEKHSVFQPPRFA
ncbi:MAG: hypothetical protein WBG71_07380 [Leeuwenhoekiella sp.]